MDGLRVGAEVLLDPGLDRITGGRGQVDEGVYGCPMAMPVMLPVPLDAPGARDDAGLDAPEAAGRGARGGRRCGRRRAAAGGDEGDERQQAHGEALAADADRGACRGSRAGVDRSTPGVSNTRDGALRFRARRCALNPKRPRRAASVAVPVKVSA
ncbi:MAG: hypothetical protein U0838_04345 [Chloroflexota bacterium]